MKTTIAFALAGALALIGCKNKKPAASAGSAGSAETAGSAGSAMAGSGSAGSAEGSGGSAAMAGSGSSAALDLPTEEDFEAQAKTEITDKNLTTQVKALETDLGK
jgi:hypothetical protein